MNEIVAIPNLLTYEIISINLMKQKTLILAGEVHSPDDCGVNSYGSVLYKKLKNRKDNKKRVLYVEVGEDLDFPSKEILEHNDTPLMSIIYNFYDHKNKYINNIKLKPIDQRFCQNIFSFFSDFYISMYTEEFMILNMKSFKTLSKLNS